MKTQETTTQKTVTSVNTQSVQLGSEIHYVGGFEYRELSDQPVTQIDPLEKLQQNVAALEASQARFAFMMREVSYLMKV